MHTMDSDENCIEDGFDIVLEHFAWMLGWIEGWLGVKHFMDLSEGVDMMSG